MAINTWYFTCMANYLFFFSAIGASLAELVVKGWGSPFLVENIPSPLFKSIHASSIFINFTI